MILKKDAVDGAGDLSQAIVRTHGGHVRHVYEYAPKGFAVEMSDAQALAMSDDAQVDAVYEDSQPPPPNSTQSGMGWALDRIDQRDLPVDGLYTYPYSGAGVTVYVVDTGVNHITDFGNRIVREINFAPQNGVVNPSNVADCYGHGTSVADAAAGTTYGVAKDANIVNVRVYPCASEVARASDYVAGLNWIIGDHAANPGSAVVNLDLQSYPYDAMDSAAMAIVTNGMLLVSSAGNDYNQATNGTAPCEFTPQKFGGSVQGIMTVGATSSSDTVSSFSNQGPCVDMFAPGENVQLFNSAGSSVPWSGTSFSAPYTSGVAALFLQQFPGVSPGDLDYRISSVATAGRLTGVVTGTPNLLLYDMYILRHRACCI